MNKIRNLLKLLKNSPMKNLFSIGKWLIMIWLLALNPTFAQNVKLEQGQNGGIDKDPVSPVNWATGNSNSGNSHFFEGQSIPYRMTISRLRAGDHTVEIEWDTRTNNKSAIDYITSFDRICEEVVPSEGIPNFGVIPAPKGIPQPSTSFDQLSDDERRIAIYGGTLGEIKYVHQDDITATSAVTRLSISFTAGGSNGPNNTVVIAWGGHIAKAQDWGEGNSASSINGSPYHTRVISVNGKSVGSQDRSVQAASEVIEFKTDGKIKGDKEVCEGSTASYSVPVGASGYAWTVNGGEITSGQGTNTIIVNWTIQANEPVDRIVSVDISNQGLCGPISWTLDVDLAPTPVISIEEVMACSSEEGGSTAIVDLREYASTTSGSLVFKKVLAGGFLEQIEDPANYSAKVGDEIEVSVAAGSSCSTEPKTFTIVITERQTFGVCAPFAGKVYEVIGSELTMLHDLFDPAKPLTTNEVFYIDKDKVLIEVIFKNKGILQDLIDLLIKEYDFEFSEGQIGIKEFDDDFVIAGFIPVENLERLNQLNQEILEIYGTDYIQYVRPAFPPITNVGITTTQGDKVMRSDLVRIGYTHSEEDLEDINGKGINIGVLSDSYATRVDVGVNPLALDIANGDLPAELFFLRDLPSRYGRGTDEGRAMLQIVHDIAPGALLGFRTGVVTAGDFAQGILDLAEEGSDIIVDDITYITEPFYKDGRVARAVNEVTSNGVSYFTSAGNFGSKSYESEFKPTSDVSIALPLNKGDWSQGRVHDFGNGKTTQTIKVFPGQNGPAVYMIALQWDDPLYSIEQLGSLYDLDIYLKDYKGAPLFGFNRNNENGDPIEILSFTVSEETTIELVIARECAACTDIEKTGIKFKYVVFRGELDPNDPNGIGSSTVTGHANSEGAMTVGAVLYANTSVFGFDPKLVPENVEKFTVATFSSRGGTTTNGVIRDKPDFTGPNGGNTTVNLGAPDIENDSFPNFFGTSAAAPHVAAVAALIKQARLKYYPESTPPDWESGIGENLPVDIRKAMKNSSEDMHEVGFDFKSGSGMVRADRALLALANPNPSNIKLVYDEGIVPGQVGFKLVITGTNLIEDSEVYFREELLESVYNEETGNLEVNIPPFEFNPGITVVNQPKSDSGIDGGTAGPVSFFDIPKRTVAIKVDNLNKKFGQSVDPLSFKIIELNEENEWGPSSLTLAEIGLTLDSEDEKSSLKLLTISSTINQLGGNLAEVGTYIIIASHPSTGLFNELFNYAGVATGGIVRYPNGVYTVEQLPITIQPKDIVLEYGESISDAIQYEVIIAPEDAEKIPDLEALKADILQKYLLDLEEAKQEGDDSLPLGLLDTNGRTLIYDELINLSFMVSGKVTSDGQFTINGREIINGRELINGREIINSVVDIPLVSFLNYLETVDNQNLINAVINGREIINAQTIINGRELINGQQLINGRELINASLLLNGQTLINGREIINSDGNEEEIEEIDELDNVLIIFRESDLEGAEVVKDNNGKEYYDFGEIDENAEDQANLKFFSITLVSSLGVGNNFILPGSFESRNFKAFYLPGKMEITPAKLTVTTSADPSEIAFGDDAPKYSSEFEGFAYSTTFKFINENEEVEVVEVKEDKASVVEKIEYSLIKEGENIASTDTDPIAIGTYKILPKVTLFTPANYTVDLENPILGRLTVTGCINQDPKVGEFETAMGAGKTSNPATIKKPTGTKEGDLLVVGLMFEKGQAPSISPPEGWVEILRTNQLNQVAMATYYKVAGKKEPDTYGFRINQSPKWTMGITQVSGADIHHPEGPIAAFSGASGSQAFVATAPSITTEDCNSLVMLFYTNKKNATWTPPPGTIEVYDDPNNRQGLTSNMMAYFIQGDAGATGDMSATASLSEHWVAQAIAIRPLRISHSSSARTLTEDMVESSVMTIGESPTTLDIDGTSDQIKAYPNPVSDLLNISLKGFVESEPTENSLVILDAMGRIRSVQRIWYPGESRMELDFSHMNKGFYIINVQTLQGIKSIRVIKQSQ